MTRSPLSNPDPQPFTRGTLWQRMVACTHRATQMGALHSIATTQTYLEHNGLQFIVRTCVNIARKDAIARIQMAQKRNPFLPYDAELYVADLSPTHIALLNKYNVVDHHLLIITRDFEPQASKLTAADFLGLAIAMAEVDGLSFYNGGTAAGASQPHKHLQLVPFPLARGALPLPLNHVIAAQPPQADRIQQLAAFPFHHGWLPLALDWTHPPEQLAPVLLSHYQTLCTALGIQTSQTSDLVSAYNLLLTREWMLLVPRRQDTYAGISVNALGFAGSLFVKNTEQFAQLQAIGPIQLLQQVACPL